MKFTVFTTVDASQEKNLHQQCEGETFQSTMELYGTDAQAALIIGRISSLLVLVLSWETPNNAAECNKDG